MTTLAHVNIRTSNLEKSVAFYRDVLGLVPGPAATRPQSSDHVWMSDERGRPCIHLQRTNGGAEQGGERCGMHHLALACPGAAQWREKLRSMNVGFQESEFAPANIVQFNLLDPDGVRIELMFEAT